MKKILIAILARDKEATLPLYLDCISRLDYPKELISLYVRTNNNSDKTPYILTDWLQTWGNQYAKVVFDNSEIDKELTRHHDWNYDRFKVLGKIRNESLIKTIELGCDYYFVADCDNFILPHTLKDLLKHDVPIIAPFLVSDRNDYYSNFHYDIDVNGYYKDHEMYRKLFKREVVGIVVVKVVHCTYLVRADAIPFLSYDDGSGRYEYVIFSNCARNYGKTQFLDNQGIYGLITFKTQKEEMEGFTFNNLPNLIEQYHTK